MRRLPKLDDDLEAGDREHAAPLRARGARGGAGDLIRVADNHDCDALANIHAASFAHAWTAESIAALMDSGAEALTAGDAAFILSRVAADEAEILTLAVIPEARRRGLAAALLNAAATRARALGARTMFLEVSAGNAAAQALYAQAGFREIARRARYFEDGSDALVLSRGLA